MILSNHKKTIEQTIISQEQTFTDGITKGFTFRKKQLENLYEAVKAHENSLLNALYKDLRKSKSEAYLSEIGVVYKEISFVLSKLKTWMKAEKVFTPIFAFPAKSKILCEPLGKVLIIGPWNYPFHLLFVPLVGAIAAGNCVVLKPSEHAPHTAKVIETILTKIFANDYVSVFQGDASTSQALLDQPFDHIFFTGSCEVGKIVAQRAAKHLIPTTLELGGKSPCIVTSCANIDIAVKRIVFGKFMNMGQTCIAPDYLYIDTKIKEKFLSALKLRMEVLFGEKFEKCQHLARIINEKNFLRLSKLIKKECIFIGGLLSQKDLFISPTVLTNVTWDDAIMREEIFGPILPVLEYSSLSDVVHILKRKAKPLALYLFAENKKVQSQILEDLSFGGGCVNDTLIHVANYHLPFGGVGMSGQGAYRGKESFNTFSHKKSISITSSKCDLPLRYPPFSHFKDKIFRFFLK